MIKEQYFIGEVPRMHRRLMPAGAFEWIKDANLEDGSIKAWKCPEKICDLDYHAETIYDIDSCCASASSYSFVHYKNSGCDYYIRNNRGRLEWAEDPCGDWACLTMSCPSRSPTITLEEDESCDPTLVSYVYTYKNALGLESSPSPVGKLQVSGTGKATVTFPVPNNECVEKVVIYRLEDGHQAGIGQPEFKADFFYVGEVDAGTTEFQDNTGIGCSGKPLHSDGAFPPPRTLEGLDVLSNGALVGFSGCILHFSDPVDFSPNPHAWSGDWDIELPDQIKAILVVGDILYVATDGHPYIVSAKGVGNGFVYDYIQIPQRLPIVSARSLHKTENGAGYVAASGLVHFSSQGALVVTDNYFTRTNWRAAQIYDAIEVAGRSVLIGANTSYIMWSGTSYRSPKELQPISQITLLGTPQEMYVDEDEDLIYTADDGLYKFTFEERSEGDDCCPYEAMSKVYVKDERINYGGAKVGTDGEVEFALFKVDCNESLEKERRTVGCCKFRLPAKYSGTDFQYYLKGCDTVYSVHIAETFTELGN